MPHDLTGLHSAHEPRAVARRLGFRGGHAPDRGVRAGRSASNHSAHAASATSITAFPIRRRRMTDA